MQQLFISDLHLSPEHPRLVRGFLDLLAHYQGNIDQLYILGDWFEAWIGDDDDAIWLDEIVTALKKFIAHGSQVLFMHGNRDFALGQRFLDRFGGKLLDDEVTLKSGHLTLRIEHGDALCTDDVNFQKFRKISRNKWLLKAILCLPLNTRRKIAETARQKSQASNAHKEAYIMDVNEAAVQQILQQHNILLHGHTHRPAIHDYANNKKRYVLGDWRENAEAGKSEAVIAILNEQDGIQLKTWYF